MPKTTLLERIEILSHELGISVPEVIARAVEAGVCALYRQRMAEKYMEGRLSHEIALQLLGPQEVARLDCIMERACELAQEEVDLICGHA